MKRQPTQVPLNLCCTIVTHGYAFDLSSFLLKQVYESFDVLRPVFIAVTHFSARILVSGSD